MPKKNNRKTKILKTIDFAVKGFFMGSSDILPGISGGTIALILGIYERLINAIKGINIRFVKPLFFYLLKWDKKSLTNLKTTLKPMDLKFLIPLIIGDATAFIIGAKIIKRLLDSHPIAVYSFFVGLIAVSIKILLRKVEGRSFINFLMTIIGAVIGAILALSISISAPHTLTFIFFSAIAAICAMLLPGISGSYVLLILGQYNYMLGVLNDFAKNGNLITIAVFITGLFIGLISFSRVISYLLKKYHRGTMSFLVGLMLGSLIFPIRKIYQGIAKGTNPKEIILSIVFLATGIAAIEILDRVDKKIRIKKKY